MLLSLLNQLLTHDEPAREKLAGFAGKRIRISVVPIVLNAEINPRGFLEELPSSESAPKVLETEKAAISATKVPSAQMFDLTITIPLAAAPLALFDKARFIEQARVEGNIALANAFNEATAHLPLALEAETARWVGPVVAQQIKLAGEGVRAALARVSESATRNIAHALTQPTATSPSALPRPDELSAWAYEVNGVTARVQALSQRVARLR